MRGRWSGVRQRAGTRLSTGLRQNRVQSAGNRGSPAAAIPHPPSAEGSHMRRTITRSRRRGPLGLAVTATLVLAACGSSTTTTSSAPASSASGPSVQQSIANEGPAAVKGSPVQIATDATYAPNEFINPDNGNIQGWDIDLGNSICKVLGLVCTFNNVTFDDIIAQ